MSACFDFPAGVQLAPDSVGVPAPPVAEAVSLVQRENTKIWLPRGLNWGLHIEHDHRVTTGPFVGNRSDRSWCWHITVSPWQSVDAMRETLHTKAAEVHFVIGGRKGTQLPVVIQCLPLNEYGKGLVHPAGTPETNRADVIQCEVCAEPEDMGSFDHYKALANLFAMCTHGVSPRIQVTNRLARSFANSKRFTPNGYPRVRGHHGHRHVPNNDHDDPTKKFEGTKLVRLVESAPNDLS